MFPFRKIKPDLKIDSTNMKNILVKYILTSVRNTKFGVKFLKFYFW